MQKIILLIDKMEHNKKIPYDKAYCSIGEKREYSLDELNIIFNKVNGLGEIKHHLFCPNCKMARLSYTAKTNVKRAYLSANSLNEHRIDCFYRYDYLSKKKAIEYISSMNDNQIEDRLNSVLRKLDDLYVESEGAVDKDNIDISATMIEARDENDRPIQRVTRKKKLSDRTKFEEFNNVYLFYGIVKLQRKDISYDKGTLYALSVISENNRVICSIKCGKNKYEIKEGIYYKIAVWGLLEKNKGFINIKPVKMSAMKIVEVINS